MKYYWYIAFTFIFIMPSYGQNCDEIALDTLDLQNQLVDHLVETIDDPSINFNNCVITFAHYNKESFIFLIQQFSALEGGIFNDYVVISNNGIDELNYNHHQAEELQKYGNFCMIKKDDAFVLKYVVKDENFFSLDKAKLVYDPNDE